MLNEDYVEATSEYVSSTGYHPTVLYDYLATGSDLSIGLYAHTLAVPVVREILGSPLCGDPKQTLREGGSVDWSMLARQVEMMRQHVLQGVLIMPDGSQAMAQNLLSSGAQMHSQSQITAITTCAMTSIADTTSKKKKHQRLSINNLRELDHVLPQTLMSGRLSRNVEDD